MTKHTILCNETKNPLPLAVESTPPGIKVIFSDESGQNLTLVKPTQYDGRRHDKSG